MATLRDLINYVKFQENCTQKDIAQKISINNSYLSDLLSGKYNDTNVIDTMYKTFPYLNRTEEEKKKKDDNRTSTDNEPNRLIEIIHNQQQTIYELQQTIAKLINNEHK